MQVAQNMATAGLNQEDIFDAIVGRITQRESRETKEMQDAIVAPRNFLLLMSHLVELGMTESKPFKTLMGRANDVFKEIDKIPMQIEQNERANLLRGIMARNLQDDPAIKPIVSAFKLLTIISSIRCLITSRKIKTRKLTDRLRRISWTLSILACAEKTRRPPSRSTSVSEAHRSSAPLSAFAQSLRTWASVSRARSTMTSRPTSTSLSCKSHNF